MARPLLREASIKELTKIQKEIESQATDKAAFVELSVEQARKLNDLIVDVLKFKPVVFEDEYLTPNEASEMVGVSRPLIMEMLKNNSLIGHQVGTHWRIKKQSLVEYMNRRDKAHQAVKAMDEDGFGLD